MVKKFTTFCQVFLLVIMIVGCGGSGTSYPDSSSHMSSATSSQSSQSNSVTQSSSSYTPHVDIKKAAITAQCFVEDRLGKCNFPLLDVRGEELSTNNFKVMQKFTRKADGEQYIYRIFIKYNGGEWEDRNNWTVSDLTIENTMTGQQYHY